MRIGVFLKEEPQWRNAMSSLARQFRILNHTATLHNLHLFKSHEKDRFDGVFLPQASDELDDKFVNQVIDAYHYEDTAIFIVERDEEGRFFVGESPHVDEKHFYELVEFLANDNNDD